MTKSIGDYAREVNRNMHRNMRGAGRGDLLDGQAALGGFRRFAGQGPGKRQLMRRRKGGPLQVLRAGPDRDRHPVREVPGGRREPR